MKKLVKEIMAYRYGELEEYAQEKARENYLAEEHLPEFFSEDLTGALNEQYGLFNLKTCYSLSNCQGDGLCLYGKITCSELFDNDKFKKIAFNGIHHRQIQSVKDELQGIDFEHNNRYYHAHTVHIESHEYEPSEKQAAIIEKITGNVKEWYFSFCRQWEKQGYDYFYEMSGEEMKEICEVNDYLFTKEGKIICMDEYRELTV
jgi:hypothetical protein